MKHFVHQVLLAAAVLSGTAAAVCLAADRPGCKDPDWAPQRFTGFEIESCETKPWEPLRLNGHGAKSVELEAEVQAVHYRLTDKKHDPHAREVSTFYREAARKAGAEAVTAATDDDSVWSKASGGRWLLYDHGSGSANSTASFTLRTARELPLPIEVEARTMPAALDTRAACADPSWLAKPFPGFKRRDCEAKPWAQLISTTDKGDQVLEGRYVIVHYEVIDSEHRPHPVAVRRNFIAALEKVGATALQAGDSDNHPALFSEQTPQGKFWLAYGASGGSADSLSGFQLVTVQEAPLEQEVEAKDFDPAKADTADCADPPWLVKNVSGFSRHGCAYRDFDQVELNLLTGKQVAAGRVLETRYTVSDAKQAPSPEAVRLNFVRGLEKLGATLRSDPKQRNLAVLTRKTPHGELWYEWRGTSGSERSLSGFSLITVVPGPPPVKCTLEVYGVNFDFDKAVLRPDSAPVLEQLLAMLKGAPDYTGEIGGHTDNVGKADYNRTLSGQRAAAVKAWLVEHGIDTRRLTTQGYGDTRPLVPNDSAENRAKNRRVELERDHCK